MSDPQFTIVTPSYNYAKYVRECLESVKMQKGATFEHLVFDAGSTDGTLDIIREYPHVDLVVEPDKGMSDAINKGFRKARGEWVMWLNSDDRLLPGALEAVAAFAAKHPEADVIHGAWNFIDADGRFKRTMKAIPYSFRMIVEHGCYIASTSTFLRRATTVADGFLLNERFRFVMDGELYARLGKAKKKFVAFDKPLADFRQHSESLSLKQASGPDIDSCLTDALRRAEPTAIRRAYGISPFRSFRWNLVADAFLYEAYRVRKALARSLTK